MKGCRKELEAKTDFNIKDIIRNRRNKRKGLKIEQSRIDRNRLDLFSIFHCRLLRDKAGLVRLYHRHHRLVVVFPVAENIAFTDTLDLKAGLLEGVHGARVISRRNGPDALVAQFAEPVRS